MRTPIAGALLALVAAVTACDDGTGRSTTGVEAGRSSTGSSGGQGLAAVELTRDWGCGFGFARSDEAQTTMLLVHLRPDAVADDRVVRLPDAGWDAVVQVGEDLGANWCTDVIVDPQRRVDETWEVVRGTLRLLGPLPPAEPSGAPTTVRAEVVDLVVTDGAERVRLGDVPLRNDTWGLLAG